MRIWPSKSKAAPLAPSGCSSDCELSNSAPRQSPSRDDRLDHALLEPPHRELGLGLGKALERRDAGRDRLRQQLADRP